MSQFTLDEWLQLVADLKTSQTEFNAGTASPIFHVQEEKKTFGFHPDYADDTCWVDGEEGTQYSSALDFFNSLDIEEKHAINGVAVEEDGGFFTDLKKSDQDAVIKEYAKQNAISLDKVAYKTDWHDIGVFLTHQEAKAFIARKQHDYGKLRVYVKSLYWAPQHKRLIQAILNGEITLIGNQEIRQSRTADEIINQTKEIVDILAKNQNFEKASDVHPWESKSQRVQGWWNTACLIQELLTETDPNDAVFEIEEGGES